MQRLKFCFLSPTFRSIRSIAKHLLQLFLFLLFLIQLNCTKKSLNGGKPITPVYPVICDAPAWSPDGNTIAYLYWGVIAVRQSGAFSIDPNLYGIWFISPDGSNKRMFLQGGESPDWSPDGQKIVFEAGAQIYKINISGDSLTQLTFGGRNFYPDWSPDGNRIAYERSTNEPDTSAESSSMGIWIMDEDGTNKTPISAGRYGEYPDWSPDSKKILCEIASYTPGNKDVDHYFWILSLEDANHIRLPLIRGDNRHPVFSPDGRKIAFSSAYNSLPQIYVMNSDGSNLIKLTTEGGTYPCWSPDGSKIAFVSYNLKEYSSKQGQIWIMNADGSNKRQLTFDGW